MTSLFLDGYGSLYTACLVFVALALAALVLYHERAQAADRRAAAAAAAACAAPSVTPGECGATAATPHAATPRAIL